MKIPVEVDLGILDTYHLEDLELVYAVAELIDNSIGSYFRNRDIIKSPLIISIDCTSDRFIISDNAAGISAEDFRSALILGRKNKKSRIENDLGVYGVGLKRSILWIGRTTTFKSSSLKDSQSYILTYPQRNVDGSYKTESDLELVHYDGKSGLTIEITGLYEENVERFSTTVVDNLKESLGLIYKKYLESEEIFITINTQKLHVNKREILVDRYYTSYKETGSKQAANKYCLVDHKSKKVEWKLPIEASRGNYRISGWLGIKKGAQKSGLGIYVYREKRGILGIPPAVVYNPFGLKVGDSNYLRLIGEIEIHGFKKPTMGNALPEKSILDSLFIDFKQNLTYGQVQVPDEILYKFFKQLTQHKVNMIDSRPCQDASQDLVPRIEVQKDLQDGGDVAKGRLPYNDGVTSREVNVTEIRKEVSDFSCIVDSRNFKFIVHKSSYNEITYSVDGTEFQVEIRSVTNLANGYLKLLANYILLFDEANPILKMDPRDMSKLLPQ
jgi:hypothetical protein